jgi:deoxyribodipyrimidine photolyase
MPKTTLVWFRQELRLADNPALAAAVKSAGKSSLENHPPVGHQPVALDTNGKRSG